MLRKIQAQGKYETAHRIKQQISQVSRFAISDGWAERDPAADLRGLVKSMPAKAELP
ncbi:phage integrase central domain-containing protein [Marinobacter sp. W-8]|uniref:phage integrase central domain-containing protein n=1 Tax=Marinobacter sp. W-8 TaxID=3369658 RepID=UPI0037C647C7